MGRSKALIRRRGARPWHLAEVLQTSIVVLVREHFQHVSRSDHGSNAMEALVDIGIAAAHVHQTVNRHRDPISRVLAQHAVIQAGVVDEVEFVGLEVVVRWCDECLIQQVRHWTGWNIGKVISGVCVWSCRQGGSRWASLNMAVLVRIRMRCLCTRLIPTRNTRGIRWLLNTDECLLDVLDDALDQNRGLRAQVDVVNDLSSE